MATHLPYSFYFVVICQNILVTTEQNPQLIPNGRLQFCEGENQNFTCTPTEGPSFWTIRGLSGVSNETSITAFSLNTKGIRFTSPDVNHGANPSLLTILNLVPEDTGATLQCVDSKLDSSTLAEILVVEFKGGMVLTIKSESLCPRGKIHFMVEFTDIHVNECFSMFGVNLTYNVTSEQGVAIATGIEVYTGRDVLYSTSPFVLPVGNNYITVSTQGKGFSETQPIPSSDNILQVDLKVKDKLFTVTCRSSCNIDILSQHFQCRAYPFNNTEWSVTENFINGRAELNLTIENDAQPIQRIIVELVSDNIVTEMKVITVNEDESDGESASNSLSPAGIAGVVIGILCFLILIAVSIVICFYLIKCTKAKSSSDYPKATETKTDERQEARYYKSLESTKQTLGAAELPNEYASLDPVEKSEIENPVKIDQEGYAKVEMYD